jgi:hypothetical protein
MKAAKASPCSGTSARAEGNCEGEEQAVQAVISLERLVVDRLSPPTGG